MMHYPVETQITPLTTIRRERLLPVGGEVLVGTGEMVGPADVVARCRLPGEVRVVDASRALGIRRERVSKYARTAIGDTVQAGDVLAAPQGLLGRFKRSCRSPVDGQIIAVRNGMFLIEAAPTTYELHAHIKGQVTNIMPRLGVVISTVGALIQGVWGSGGEAEGILKALIVGGRILDEEPLEKAVEAQIRGLVVGSVNADLRSALQSLPFPVLLTEGFGMLPMSERTFQLLHSNLGREAMLSGVTQARRGLKRPELLIPLRSEEELPSEESRPRPLEIGMEVRTLRAPYLGATGTVIDLPARPRIVESGGRLPVAEVELDKQGTVIVPVANLELIR
jgi:hypothetical protein